MRKALSLLLALVMCLSLCACGKSAAAETVDRLIEAIGTVTLESERAITEAENAYAQLPDSDKKKVENLAALMEARTAYNDLLNAYEEITSGIEQATLLIGQCSFAEAMELLLDLAESADDSQLALIEGLQTIIETSYYENTEFIRLENIVLRDENGIVQDNEYVTHDINLCDDGQVHLYSFFNGYDGPSVSLFEEYLKENYSSSLESLDWCGDAGMLNGSYRNATHYYDENGNRLAMIFSSGGYITEFQVFIQYAEYVN